MFTYIIARDSTNPADITGNPAALIVYMDGLFANEAAMRKRFPDALILALTSRGALAEGIDWEPGNAVPDPGAWVLAAGVAGFYRPAVYADLVDTVGAVLPSVEAMFGPIPPPGPDRPYRILTAHPTGREHICGPSTCGELPVDADGTQYDWAETYDISALREDFFDGPLPLPIPPLPTGEDAMSVAITVADGIVLIVAEAQPAGPGKCGEIYQLWTTLPGAGSPDSGPVWHGTPGKTSHDWVSAGTPGA